ncbi:MAG: hypothetical protein KIT17_07970 [Rubrivivax sp.]|nr:hypothetical protein [Rubrivivax sp.]
MHRKPIRHFTLAAVAAASVLFAAAAAAGVPHRSGGASVEEFTELRRLASEHSLKLVLAARGSGAYLADVDVTVRALDSGDVLLQHRTEGPLLLASLPPGRYEVIASFADVLPGAPDTVRRVLEVPRSGLAQAVLYFDTGDQVAPDSPPAFRLN